MNKIEFKKEIEKIYIKAFRDSINYIKYDNDKITDTEIKKISDLYSEYLLCNDEYTAKKYYIAIRAINESISIDKYEKLCKNIEDTFKDLFYIIISLALKTIL